MTAVNEGLKQTQVLTSSTTSSDPYNWDGGRGTWIAFGTYSNATASLQFSPDSGTTWLSAQDQNGTVSLSANGARNFEFGRGIQIRSSLAGATGSTSVTSNFYIMNRPGQ